jgi:hypothetical protein
VWTSSTCSRSRSKCKPAKFIRELLRSDQQFVVHPQGKMLKDFGVATSSDWTGLPEIMRQELRASGDADEASVEYRVIAASE